MIDLLKHITQPDLDEMRAQLRREFGFDPSDELCRDVLAFTYTGDRSHLAEVLTPDAASTQEKIATKYQCQPTLKYAGKLLLYVQSLEVVPDGYA